MILLRRRKRCSQVKSSICSGRWSKTQNGDQNRIYPSLRLQNVSLLKRVFKTHNTAAVGTFHRTYTTSTPHNSAVSAVSMCGINVRYQCAVSMCGINVRYQCASIPASRASPVHWLRLGPPQGEVVLPRTQRTAHQRIFSHKSE